MDFGAWEGVPWASVPRAELGRLGRRLPARPAPTGARAYTGCTSAPKPRSPITGKPGLSHIIVTHAGIIKAARVQSGDPGGWKRTVDFGEIIGLQEGGLHLDTP